MKNDLLKAKEKVLSVDNEVKDGVFCCGFSDEDLKAFAEHAKNIRGCVGSGYKKKAISDEDAVCCG